MAAPISSREICTPLAASLARIRAMFLSTRACRLASNSGLAPDFILRFDMTLTSFSFVDCRVNFHGEAEEFDEADGVFAVVFGAHGEAGEVVLVEGVGGIGGG